jgi:predicted kinase
MDKLLHPTFYMAIGISGSGKSTILNKVFEREAIVEPDAIRRDTTGSVSDQSQDFKVWRDAAEKVKEKLNTEGLAVLDATNTKSSLRSQFLKNIPEGIRKVAIVFQIEGTDEEIVDKLYKRIQRDLKKGKDRSAVPKEVIARQLQQFKNGLKNIETQFDEVQYYPVSLEDEDDWFNITSYA